MAGLPLLLAALGYPRAAAPFDPSDDAGCARPLVAWLENMKIRQ